MNLSKTLFILASLFCTGIHAQTTLLRNAAARLTAHQNFSYRTRCKTKDYTADTILSEEHDAFAKDPADTHFGYLFRLEQWQDQATKPLITVYNGRQLMILNTEDSTYDPQKVRATAVQGTLPDRIHWILNFLAKKPGNSTTAADTLLDGSTCHHVVVNTFDTVIDQQHLYTRIHIYIDTTTGLPVSIRYRSRNKFVGDAITNYYSDVDFSNYHFDQPDLHLARAAIPPGFHLPSQGAARPALLQKGTLAPNWTLHDAAGHSLTLSDLRGKVVLLDFFFIGCPGCMLSVKPLENLQAHYARRQVVIASITERDSKAAVTAFAQNYHLPYPIYIDATKIIQRYHVTDAPVFYMIDKQGRIAASIEGYNDDFEQRTGRIIDTLLAQ